MIIKGYFCLFLHKNLCCGCSLKSHDRGNSNEHSQQVFYEELTKIIFQLSSNMRLISSSIYTTNNEGADQKCADAQTDQYTCYWHIRYMFSLLGSCDSLSDHFTITIKCIYQHLTCLWRN